MCSIEKTYKIQHKIDYSTLILFMDYLEFGQIYTDVPGKVLKEGKKNWAEGENCITLHIN